MSEQPLEQESRDSAASAQAQPDFLSEPLETVRSPYFVGEHWPDRLEVTLTTSELTDQHNIEEFGQSLLTTCRHYAARNILIDVSRLTFVTSSVLSKFIGLNRELRREGGQVVLACPGEMFADVLDATNLNDYFTVSKTLPEAREEFRTLDD